MIEKISLAHGDGGELSHKLIQEVFVDAFKHFEQSKLDSAILNCETNKIAISTDTFAVKPIFFPGGNIGKLAVAGTVNDIAVSGAVPRYLTSGFLIEEGFPLQDLIKIVEAMAAEAKKANVTIIAGDTKVVEAGNADGIYINTTGLGFIEEDRIAPEKMTAGDSIIVSGTIGDHGIAILAARGDLGIKTDVLSDCASLNAMIDAVLQNSDNVRLMRDPTRGGLATTLVEICEDFHVSMEINEEDIPVKREVQGACDILGYDPVYIANEGKIIFIVAKEDEQNILDALHKFEEGANAQVIGQITDGNNGKLFLRTDLGTTRRLNRLSGILLPRIC